MSSHFDRASLVNKDLLYGKRTFKYASKRYQRVIIPSGLDNVILPAQEVNHSARIRFTVPAHGTSHLINSDIPISMLMPKLEKQIVI